MAELEIYTSIAANLEESAWSNVLSTLDKETLSKLKAALDSQKDVAETVEEELKEDPKEALKQLNAKMTKILKAFKAHRKRFNKIDNKIAQLEANGVGGGNGGGNANKNLSNVVDDDDNEPVIKKVVKKKKKRELRSMADDPKNDVLKDRKRFYRFGYRNLGVLKPSEGYPNPKEAKRPVEGKLELFYSHGYSGNFDESRQNIALSSDGKKLLYYIASVGIVFDYAANKQQFFTLHNDDLTALCVSPDPKTPWCATGQKDPKDVPGKGKDLPKIWVWNYAKMKKVQLIDNVCWGKIARLQWSPASNFLYCICGDPEQTLKAYDPAEFKGKGQPPELIKCNTMKEQLYGFEINPNPNKASVDEFVMYGKRKFSFVNVTKAKKGLTAKLKSVSIASFKKDSEKSFSCATFLPDGRYAVGSQSGAIYVGRGSTALACVGTAHAKSVGCLIVSGNAVYSAGFDQFLRRFDISADSGNEAKKEEKTPKKGKKEGNKKKKGESKSSEAPLVEKWSCKVNIPNSDFILQPRAMVMNEKTGTLFVGTKTNQIMKFEMKEENATVVVDGHDGQIWGLCTHPKEPLFATGGYDNAIKIWDATTMKCINTFEFELEQGDKVGKQISCAAWSNDGNVLVFGTEDSCIAVFSYEPELSFQQMIEIPPKSKNAEVEPVSYLRFSDDSKLLGAAHMDANLYIFSVNGGGSGKVVLQRWDPLPHVAAPTNVQFSKDGTMVKTLTRDYEIVHWDLNNDAMKGKFQPSIPDPDKIEWADDPLIAGWDVEGLYQPGWDGTDLNDATLTSDGKLVVSGDDYGTVRLHNYPAIVPSACLEYGGHAEFVVGVEFLRDDSQLISCGGNDMAIFQWKLHKNYK